MTKVSVYFKKNVVLYSAQFVNTALTLWRRLLPYGYSYTASCARPG